MASNITLQHKAPIATTSLRALLKSTKKAVTSAHPINQGD